MQSSPEVLILGGGVIGLTTAYYLARTGTRVRVLDRGDLGQEASWAGAGILTPGSLDQARTPYDRLRAHSLAQFPHFSQELLDRTGVDNGYRRCGALEFVGVSAEVAEAEWRGEGARVERLTESAVRQLEPQLGPELGAAVLLPELAQLRNPWHVRALKIGCERLGVTLSPGCGAAGFEFTGSRVDGVRTADGVLRAERYLIAAGAWSDDLLAPLGWSPGIVPVRGQIALLQGPPLVSRVLLWGPRYLVPRSDGRVLIGSTEEHVGFDKHTTAAAIDNLLRLGMKLVPALTQCAVERCWAGLRPHSPDDLPYLGVVPGHDNVYVSAGHFRSGIQLSPASALLMKEMLLGEPPSLAVEPYRLDRPAARRVDV